MKDLLIATIIAAIFCTGLAVGFADVQLDRNNHFYFFKWVGERLEVHFLTFAADGKQRKHLEYSQRRLEEALLASQRGMSKDYSRAAQDYDRELGKAYYMAEQLTLINPRYKILLAEVYIKTLLQLDEASQQENCDELEKIALRHNTEAIKRLLQKHQDSQQDTKTYQSLVGLMLESTEQIRGDLSVEQDGKINLARNVLAEGVEIEWAYDLLASVR